MIASASASRREQIVSARSRALPKISGPAEVSAVEKDRGERSVSLSSAAKKFRVPLTVVGKAVAFVLTEDPGALRFAEVAFRFQGMVVRHRAEIDKTRLVLVRGDTYHAIICRPDARLEATATAYNAKSRIPSQVLFGALMSPSSEPKSEPRINQRLARVWQKAASRAKIAAALFVALAVIGITGYQKLILFHASGFVTSPDIEYLRAERPGVFYSYITHHARRVAARELIGFIQTTGGKTVPVTSPCDCFIGDLPVHSGNSVFKGAIVARFIPLDAAMEIRAALPLAMLSDVSVGDDITIRLLGTSARAGARIVSVHRNSMPAVSPSDMTEKGIPGLAAVVAKPESELLPMLIGTEVQVRFSRLPAIMRALGLPVFDDPNPNRPRRT
ncbi:MAG: hypothetical protein ACRED5_20355 [Propylenella sp.]